MLEAEKLGLDVCFVAEAWGSDGPSALGYLAARTQTAGKMTYDLRRLRAHRLILRVPHSRRYHITDTALQHALLFTHAHDHLLRTGLAEITDLNPPAPSRLRTAAHAYQTAFHDLARYAHLAA